MKRIRVTAAQAIRLAMQKAGKPVSNKELSAFTEEEIRELGRAYAKELGYEFIEAVPETATAT